MSNKSSPPPTRDRKLTITGLSEQECALIKGLAEEMGFTLRGLVLFLVKRNSKRKRG